MTTLMRCGRDRRSGKPVKCHARKERALLVGTRSANHIRAGGHSGCTQRPNTWLHPNASRKRQIPLASRAPSIHGTLQPIQALRITAAAGATHGRSATFVYPEIDLGLIPAFHFMHLPRIVGRHRAFELLFSGRTFDADEAASLGLVSRIVPDEKVPDEARAMARVFATKSRTTMRLGRAAFVRANDLDYRRSIGDAVENFCKVATTDDAQEGLRAFKPQGSPNLLLAASQRTDELD